MTPDIQYIPDLFELVVAKVALKLNRTVYFDAGHYAEVTKRLTQKDGEMTDAKREKYPLVWLVMDFEERRGRVDGYIELPNVQIIIATDTESWYTREQRRDEKFIPVLYPIYAELLNQIQWSRSMSVLPTIPHSKYDRPYWGGQESGNSERNLFNDMIDAIQIKGLTISIKTIC